MHGPRPKDRARGDEGGGVKPVGIGDDQRRHEGHYSHDGHAESERLLLLEEGH